MLLKGYYRLLSKPTVYAVGNKQPLKNLTNTLGNQEKILVHLPWNHADVYRMLKMKAKFHKLKNNNYDPYLVCNTISENIFRKLFNTKGFHSNIYIYVNENDYVIKENTAKVYDAIYTAQMLPFKRIELAKQIDKLFILTYKKGSKSNFKLHEFCPQVSHADYNLNWVNINEKVDLYNKSRVGLCLSKEEGMMLASLEYMLCGLPIVSTKSLGGRNQYYNNDYCIIAKSNSKSIKNAVKELIERNIDPYYIRQKTVEKLTKDKMDFLFKIRKITGLKSTDKSFIELERTFLSDPAKLFIKY